MGGTFQKPEGDRRQVVALLGPRPASSPPELGAPAPTLGLSSVSFILLKSLVTGKSRRAVTRNSSFQTFDFMDKHTSPHSGSPGSPIFLPITYAAGGDLVE